MPSYSRMTQQAFGADPADGKIGVVFTLQFPARFRRHHLIELLPESDIPKPCCLRFIIGMSSVLCENGIK